MVEEPDLGPDGRSEKSLQAFRTISEVATELDVAQHVLRFWETKFPQISPLKRGGGRRYYRPEDIALLTRIRDLLYRDGYTIKGAQKLLRDNSRRAAGAAPKAAGTGSAAPKSADAPAARDGALSPAVRSELQAVVRDLKDLKTLIDRALR